MHLMAEGHEIKVLANRMGPHSFAHKEGSRNWEALGKEGRRIHLHASFWIDQVRSESNL
jgi:hypothetical protein